MIAHRRRFLYLSLYLLLSLAAVALLAWAAAWACGDPPWFDINGIGEGDIVQGDVPLEGVPDGGGDAAAFPTPWGPVRALAASAKPAAGHDLSKIARVDFVARGEAFASLSRRARYLVTWDTTKFHDGHCAVKAVAYDAAGNQLGRSRTVNVTIANVLVIDEPTKRESVSGVVAVTGSVQPCVDVSELRLYVERELIGKATGSPFAFTWDSTTVPDGEHILRVKAYKGKTRLGHAAVRVAVDN